MHPMQYTSALLSEALWVGLNLCGVGVHVQCHDIRSDPLADAANWVPAVSCVYATPWRPARLLSAST